MTTKESLFYQVLPHVIKIEGGYSNNPNDSGGPTNWGITEAVARAFGYLGSIKEMPKETATAIYKARYWDSLRLDEVANLSERIAFELFDTGVNLGVSRAGIFLQRSLNVLNQRGTFYPDVKVDGVVGRMTLAALSEYLKRRPEQGELVLLRALNSLQGAFYIELADSRSKDEDFVYGWLLRRVT